MADTCSIVHESIITFVRNYQYYALTPTLIVFPYSVSYLYTLSLVPTLHVFSLIHNRLTSLFLAAGFPSSSHFLRILSFSISGNVISWLLVSPSALSFLLFTKTYVILKSNDRKPSFISCLPIFKRLVATQLCNLMFKLAVHATCFFVAIMIFGIFDFLGFLSSRGPFPPLLMAIGAAAYSFLVANSEVVCNFALISSGMEDKGGFVSIFRACVVMYWGRMEAALWLTMVVNLAMAGVEVLFLYWVGRSHGSISSSYSNSIVLVVEGVSIACLYSVFLVLESVIGCTLWRYCFKQKGDRIPGDNVCYRDLEVEVQDGDWDFGHDSLNCATFLSMKQI